MKSGNWHRRAILRSAVLRRGALVQGLKWIETLESRQLLSAAPLHFNVIDLGRPGNIDTNATAVNNTGQIAGQSVTATEYRPWVYNYSTGALTDLTPVLGDEAEINSINDNGQMVGAKLTGQFNSYTGEPITTAFYYSGAGSTAVTLPLADGMESASAVGINDKGQIIVIERSVATPDGPYFFTYTHGFLYSASTGKEVSELPQGDTDVGALAINNNGQIFENAFNPPFKEDSGTVEYYLVSGNTLTPLTSSVSAPGPWFGNPIPPSLGNTIFGYQDSGGAPLGSSPFGINDAEDPFFFSGGQSVNLNDTLPANANFTVDFVDSINASNVIVGQGTNEEGQQDACLLFPVNETISGTVFNDTNHNGIQDNGETGVAGVTVYQDPNYNHKLDATEQSVITDASGNYTFAGPFLAPPADPEILRIVLPSGATQTSPANGVGIYVGKNTGQTLTGENFGISVPVKASISGTVFNDTNHDGIQDKGEAGLAGITVYQDPNYNHKLDAGEQSAVTDAQGNYTFTNLPADPEILRVVLPIGDLQTSPANGVGIYVGKNVGQAVDGLNFGILLANSGGGTGSAAVTGTVINDANGDHVFQPATEHFQAGITAFVDYNDNGILDAGEPSAISDSSGNFTIKNVADGTWYVDVVTGNNGFRRTLPVAGTDSFRVTLTGNNTAGVGIFGVTTTAYVGGTLFNDSNGNGVQDPHETPLAGWKVYIDLNNDGILESNEPTAQTVTTSTGYWYFRAVAPGTYTIRAVAPSGWTTSHAFTVTLTSGETVIDGAIGEKSA
ncbi:MAG TPA: SdrD B-like domain-containing protein [Tepidisphaeraceae bacterium]|jgi:hypothetical protein|nr:SdrD B-like domain-containing protein [Tepidisphaeraceae bacterium]